MLITDGSMETIKGLLFASNNGGTDEAKRNYEVLKGLDISEELLDAINPKGVQNEFYQLLAVHCLLENAPALKTFDSLNSFLENLPQEAEHLEDYPRLRYYLIYQEHSNHVYWSDYLKTADLKTWDDVYSFQKSMPYCKVTADDIFDIVSRTAVNFPRDGAINSLVWTACKKITADVELSREMASRLNDILLNEHLQAFLPRFLNAIVDESEERYLLKFAELSAFAKGTNSFIILKALGIACPNESKYCGQHLPLLRSQLEAQNITRADYINLSCTKGVSVQSIHDFVFEVSQSSAATLESKAVIYYLENFIDQSGTTWFQNTAANVFTNPDPDIVHSLNSFIYELVDKNLDLIYNLLTKRFETLGASSFPGGLFTSIVSADCGLFKKHLTQWLLSDNPKVHLTIRELCALHSLHHSAFTLSDEILAGLSSSDKLYIGIKIAGYVYSKEHLQNLMLSLTNSIRSDEDMLLKNMFAIYEQYIIYNYRTTLDILKAEMHGKDLPAHLKELYTRLVAAYDKYFEGLRSVPILMELQADTVISQHLHFYEQARLNKLSGKVEDKGFLSLLKNTEIKSYKWAIRREDQKIHDVQPLGHFETSTEFPMGERLNPAFQEKVRRHYQKMRKHEINID